MANLRRSLYRLASLLGDLNAVARGPVALALRVLRKVLYSAAHKFFNHLTRR